MKSSLSVKILSAIAETSFVDKIAQKRAFEISEKAKIKPYIKSGGTYLDIGTGLGHIIEQLIQQDDKEKITLLALDPIWSPQSKLRNRIANKENINTIFMKGLGQQLPVKDKALDGVFLFFVLHHVNPKEKLKILNEIKRVLKDNGLLFLIEDTPETKGEKNLNKIWDHLTNLELKNELYYYLSNNEWLKFFETNGYNVIAQTHFKSGLPMLGHNIIRHHSYILNNNC